MARFTRRPLSFVSFSVGLVALTVAVAPSSACATRPARSATTTPTTTSRKAPAAQSLVPPSSGSPASSSSSTSTLPPLRSLAELRAEARKELAEKASKAATKPSSASSSSTSTSPITSFLNNPQGWLENELKKVTARHPLVVAPKQTKRPPKAQETTPPYSPVPIPEPSTIALFGLLGATLVLRKRIWA